MTSENEYKNNRQKLNYICPNGHKESISWNGFQRGNNCKSCCDNDKRKRHHSEETRKLMSKKQKGENNSNSILTEEKVIEIWEHINKGILTQREIGEKFEVTQKTISNIKIGKTWSHIRNER